ncbi:hypothetical protein [Tardiphaga robiniae]|uniref:hypothetical protein n=1 Tax=Tardiphaga robiniae TaxID=943830 RepID=UPI001586170A|nr:hypothetical protein [Tardiphaga robiniae]NUU41857.1 hypothetical protein [Tardiphaga robiniae]
MRPGSGSTIVDLFARPGKDTLGVADRIQRRKVVLLQWLDDGIPMGKRYSVPRSLRAAREWDDPEIGIFRISSPNDFTQTHSVFGEGVREIARLMNAIAKRYGQPKRPMKPSSPPSKFNKSHFEQKIASIASQWHMERYARLNEQRRADAADQQSRILREENADLRRKLSIYQGPTIVS